MSTPRTALFHSTTQTEGPPGYPERSGQRVNVVRSLTESEADLDEVGSMFRIRFSDGIETDAFAEELDFLSPRARRRVQ